jgi:hypothetical protein
LETYVSLADAETIKVKYQTPSGLTGLLDAVVNGTTVVCTIAGGVLNEIGYWYFHAWIKFTGKTHYTAGTRAVQYVRQTFER